MIAAALLGVAVAWTYGRMLSGLAAEWASSPDASYGAILALVSIALVWHRRHAIAAVADPRGPRARPAAALLAAAALFVIGQLGADVFLTRLSLVAVLGAATWFLAGARAARLMAAPLAFLALAVPLPAILVNAITLPLQLVASRLAEATLAIVGVPVFRDGNVLVLPSATLEVAEACSGLRSLISLAALAVLFAWFTPGGLVRRGVIVAAAVPIAIVMNGWRVAATGVACETFGPGAASGTAHEAMGWITFVVSVLVLAVVQRRLDDGAARRSWDPASAPLADEPFGERRVLA